MGQKYIDSATVYELIGAFERGRKLDSAWGWESSLESTALMLTWKVALPPPPTGSRTGHGADFEYGRLIKGLGEIVRTDYNPSRKTSTLALNRTLEWMTRNAREIASELDNLFLDSGSHNSHFEPWIESAVRIGWPEHIPRLGGLYDRELIPALAHVISQTSFISGEVSEEVLYELRERTLEPQELSAIIKSAPSEFDALKAAYVAAALARGPYHEIVASSGRGSSQIVHHPMRRIILPTTQESEQIAVPNAMEHLSRIVLGSTLTERTSDKRMATYLQNITDVRSYLWTNAGVRRSLEEVCSSEEDARELGPSSARSGIG